MSKKGMLWLDSSPNKTLDEKIRKGIAYFQDKYKTDILQLCLPVNSGYNLEMFDNIPVVLEKFVMPNHILYVYEFGKSVEENP